MITLSVAKLKMFTPESKISFGIKQKKNVFVESLDHFRSLEIREKVRNVFVMSLRLSDHHFAQISSLFFAPFFALPNFFLLLFLNYVFTFFAHKLSVVMIHLPI